MNALSNEYGQNQPVEIRLQVSRYDQAASMLVSLLTLVGASVTLLAIVWLTNTWTFRPPAPIIKGAGTAQNPNTAGFEQAMAMPGLDELPELSEPQLATELEAVSDAASKIAASVERIEAVLLKARLTGRHGFQDGDSDGQGPSDIPSNPPRDDMIPRWERWQIRWTSTSLPAYIRQLDFFKIELGAAGGKKKVDYAFNLTKARPDTREGAGLAEKRLYMTWKGGKLMKFDRTILARGGIPTDQRVLLQFYPLAMEDQLAVVEKLNATSKGHANLQEICKTFFGVRPKGDGYEFFVEDQQFRVAPR